GRGNEEAVRGGGELRLAGRAAGAGERTVVPGRPALGGLWAAPGGGGGGARRDERPGRSGHGGGTWGAERKRGRSHANRADRHDTRGRKGPPRGVSTDAVCAKMATNGRHLRDGQGTARRRYPRTRQQRAGEADARKRQPDSAA